MEDSFEELSERHDGDDYDDDRSDHGGFGSYTDKIFQQMLGAEVLSFRRRCEKFSGPLIRTLSINATETYIAEIDYSKLPSKPFLGGSCGPKLFSDYDLPICSGKIKATAGYKAFEAMPISMILAAGFHDEMVNLHGSSKSSRAPHTSDGHKEEVFQDGWNAKNETILASICNLSRIDGKQTRELRFIRGSHMSRTSDSSQNLFQDLVTVSHRRRADTNNDEEAENQSVEKDYILLPPKMKDQGKLILHISFGNHDTELAMVDTGACVNMLPSAICQRLKLEFNEDLAAEYSLANNTSTRSLGMVTNISVKVVGIRVKGDILTIAADFVVMDTGGQEAGRQALIILGTPFLVTGKVKIDMAEGLLTLQAQDKTTDFQVFNRPQYPGRTGEASTSASGNVIIGKPERTGEASTSASGNVIIGKPGRTGEASTSASGNVIIGKPGRTGEASTSASGNVIIGKPGRTGEASTCRFRKCNNRKMA